MEISILVMLIYFRVPFLTFIYFALELPRASAAHDPNSNEFDPFPKIQDVLIESYESS